MNTKVSDARQKLFDLRKKYSVANLEKYEKQISSSDESLNDLSDSMSITRDRKNASDSSCKLSARSSLKSDSGSKNVSLHASQSSAGEIVKCSKEGFVLDRPKSSEFGRKSVNSIIDLDIISSNCIFNLESNLNNEKNDAVVKEVLSGSIISSVHSLSVKDNPSEIEEILSDEDIETSSINDPFANVHLVSDDILEVNSSIGSHSSIKDDIHTGRISAVQSVKSLQLSSPLDPPQLEYDYESDFQSSGDESELPKSDSEVGFDKKNNSAEINDGITYHEIQLDKTQSGKQSSCSEQNEMILIKSDSLTSIVKTKSKISETISTKISSTEESIPEVYEDNRKTEIEEYYPEEVGVKSEHDDKLSEIHTSESFSELNIKSKHSDKKLHSMKTNRGKFNFSSSLSSKNRKHKNDVAVSVHLSRKVINRNIGVQTSNRVDLSDRFEEVRSDIKSALREKWYIDTNVKNTKYRPTIKSSKLYRSSNEKSMDFNPFLFTVQEGLPLNKLLDEILRNQIAMTKHFIDCHHHLYMQCCETVKSLNKDYKKRQTTLFI